MFSSRDLIYRLDLEALYSRAIMCESYERDYILDHLDGIRTDLSFIYDVEIDDAIKAVNDMKCISTYALSVIAKRLISEKNDSYVIVDFADSVFNIHSPIRVGRDTYYLFWSNGIYKVSGAIDLDEAEWRALSSSHPVFINISRNSPVGYTIFKVE